MRAFWNLTDVWIFSQLIHGPCSILKVCEASFYLEYRLAPGKAPMYRGALTFRSGVRAGGR